MAGSGNRSQGGRGLVHFSVNQRPFAQQLLAENMDLSPSFPPCERLLGNVSRLLGLAHGGSVVRLRSVVEENGSLTGRIGILLAPLALWQKVAEIRRVLDAASVEQRQSAEEELRHCGG